MPCLALVILLLCLGCRVSADEPPNELRNDYIYYKDPVFDIKNANVTFGAIRRAIVAGGDSPDGIAEALASTCQAILINNKAYPLQINGTINLVFQDYVQEQNSGQRAIMTLLENSLYFVANNTKLNQVMNVDLTGFFGSYNFGTVKINSLSVNGYFIPFVAASELARDSPDNKLLGLFTAEKLSFAQILGTRDYSSFNAVIDTLKYFGWTLVADLYQPNIYGYIRQQNVLDYSADFDSPLFACSSFLGSISDVDGVITGDSVIQFCKCVSEKDKINVIVMWMSTSFASDVIQVIRKYCPSQSKNWTFIISEDIQSPDTYLKYSDDTLKYSLYLRDNGPWNFGEFIKECHDNTTGAVSKRIERLINLFYLEYYNCKVFLEEDDPNSYQSCDKLSRFRPYAQECLCEIGFAGKDPYVTKLFFIADIMNVYAAAISLLQNNCTFLNAKLDYGIGPVLNYTESTPDFCTKTEFTPKDLSFALQFVDIVGYTGRISFPEDSLVRREVTFYLYNTLNNTVDGSLVGVLNSTTVDIDASKITFINDEIPTSEIVPQNPDLSYAVVDVFFGVAIFELVWCFAAFMAYVIQRDNRIVRRSSPISSLIMLVSVFLLGLTQLLKCFSNTNALCTIGLYFFWIGIYTLLSCLFLKNYRLYKIFSNRTATAFELPEYKLLMVSAAVIGFYVVFMTVLVAADGYDAILKQSSSNIYYQYVRCSFNSSTWNTFFSIFYNVSMVIMVLGSLVMAWLTRKISSEYSESSALLAFSVCVAFAVIAFIPLSAALKSETDSEILRFVVSSEFLTVIIFAALSLLFMPTLIEIHKQKRREAHGRRGRSPELSTILLR